MVAQKQIKGAKRKAKESDEEEASDEYYDSMEYGDELNDDEEKDYKRERQSAKKHQTPSKSILKKERDASIEDSEDEEEGETRH